jgi:hypothetical protein
LKRWLNQEEDEKMAEKMTDHRLRIYVTLLIFVSLLLACNASSGSEVLFDLFDDSPDGAQGEQDQDQADQDQGQVQTPDQNEDEADQGGGRTEDWVLNNHAGMALWYNSAVIEDIRATTVPLTEGGYGEVAHPAYVQYSLPLDSGAIAVVEIQAYTSMSESADRIFPELRSVLANRSAMALDCIPELPLAAFFRQCSHQQLNANVEYVDFKNGTGMRFVTVYGIQDAAPISNEHLVYVYQGITNDKQCYVTASFRLSHEGLEDYAQIPRDVYRDTSGISLAEYFSEHEQLLNSQPDGYMPELERFDLIMRSVEVANCLGG